MPRIYKGSLAIMPTTFRLPFYAILDAKEISKVAVACNDTTETTSVLTREIQRPGTRAPQVEVYGVFFNHSFGLKDY